VSTDRRRYIKSGKYWFDKCAADAAIAFFEIFLRLTEGEWAGQPFILARWQRRIVRKLFGWKRRDGTRRFRRLWLEVPRKNGKTEFAAGLALLLLVADGEFGAQIYSLATEEGQARIVFDKTTRMVSMSEPLKKELETFKTSIWCAALNASFKPLSASPTSKHGFNPSGFIGDEVHAWTSGELAEVVHEGEGARAQPLDILITTAGEIGSYAHEQHEHALEVLAGEVEDDELLAVIYGAGPDDDWTDPSVHRKANPNYGVSVKPSFLESEVRKARQQPRLENRVRRYFLNQWVEQSTRWIPMEYWNVCTAAPAPAARVAFLSDPDRDEWLQTRVRDAGEYDPLLWRKLPDLMAGRRCCAGLDLATTRDLASLCLWFPPESTDARDVLIWKHYLPRESLKLKTLKSTDRQRYESFVKAGALTLTPGNVTDYAFIKTDIMEAADRFRLTALGIDRWNATQLATDLLNTEGLPVVLFGQGYVSMSPPSKEFERAFMGLQLEHGNNPVATWMARNAEVDTDHADNIKPVKPTKERKNSKIDGIVAAIMAKGMLMTKPDDTVDMDDFIKSLVTA
jgi:phage terminase large subunit-like protein